MTGPVVVKVGGSLLDWPGLADRLSSYLDDRRGDRLVLVVGGGRFADALRDLDRAQSIGEARSHAPCSASSTSPLTPSPAIVPGWLSSRKIAALPHAWETGRSPILAPRRFLDLDDRSPDPLPHAWSVTSDSIAARLAVRLGADELVLLKSAPIPPGIDLEAASRLGLVDPEIPRAASRVPVVTALNLRDPELVATRFRA